MNLDLTFLLLMLLAALGAVLARTLLKGAICLALTSVALTMLMFHLKSPLAAVFELSVCAGLITVVFISTISLTRPVSPEEELLHGLTRLRRFWLLPVILGLMAWWFWLHPLPLSFEPPPFAATQDVNTILWGERQVELLGQVIVVLAGVFGVVVLFREDDEKEQP